MNKVKKIPFKNTTSTDTSISTLLGCYNLNDMTYTITDNVDNINKTCNKLAINLNSKYYGIQNIDNTYKCYINPKLNELNVQNKINCTSSNNINEYKMYNTINNKEPVTYSFDASKEIPNISLFNPKSIKCLANF